MSASEHEPGRHFDVFVSHAGQEKWGFVSVMHGVFTDVYPQVEVFVDDWSLRAGDTGAATIKQAMDECAVAILVLSKAFIGKQWPMDELRHFRERKAGDGGNKLKIITVLYDLQFSDVEVPSGFRGLTRQQRDDITWLTTFTMIRRDQVARGEAYGLAWCVVADAVIRLQVLGRVRPYTPDVPVMFGRKDDIHSIMEELESATGSTCMLLHGVGGIGKTTLANALYQQLLQHPSCQGLCGTFKFRGDASMLTQQQDFLEKVLGMRRQRLPGNSEEAGQKMVERLDAKFQGRRLVLVVDNVPLTTTHTGSSDDRPAQQLRRLLPPRLFEPGFPVECKVLLTARGTTTFDEYRNEMPSANASPNAVARSVGKLSKDAALKLFSWHVFKQQVPFKADLPQQSAMFPPCETALPACDITLAFIRGELQKVVSQCTSHPLVLKLAAFRLRQQYSSIADLCNNLADAVKATTTWLPAIKANNVHGILEAMYRDVCNHVVCRMHMRDLLLDVAVYLCGQPWKMLEAYQPTEPPGMLKELADKGFLRKAWSGGVQVVDMHDIVREFCLQKAAELGQQAEQCRVLCLPSGGVTSEHDPWDPSVVRLLMDQCEEVRMPSGNGDGTAGANLRVVHRSELASRKASTSRSWHVLPSHVLCLLLHKLWAMVSGTYPGPGSSAGGDLNLDKLRWLALSRVQPRELLQRWFDPVAGVFSRSRLQVVVLNMLPLEELRLEVLQSVRFLRVQDMQLLVKVEGLEALMELTELQVLRCAALQHPLFLPATIARVELQCCPLLRQVDVGWRGLNLRSLLVTGCGVLAVGDGWLSAPNLNGLQLQLHDSARQCLAGVSRCRALQDVDISLMPTPARSTPEPAPAQAAPEEPAPAQPGPAPMQIRDAALYDVYISQASDHDTLLAELYIQLSQVLNLRVYAADYSPPSNLEAIMEALQASKIGVVILSEHFMTERFRMEELEVMMSRARQGAIQLLPVLRDVTMEQVTQADLQKLWRTAGRPIPDRHTLEHHAELLRTIKDTFTCICKDRLLYPELTEKIADAVCGMLLASGGDSLVAGPRLLKEVQQLLEEEHTMVLLHGVAGSGKTTLLDATYLVYSQYDCKAKVQLRVDATDEDICRAQQHILSSIDPDTKCGDSHHPTRNHDQLLEAFKEMARQAPPKQLWLVVDNVWRDLQGGHHQLQRLLPDNTLEVLAPGSKVLVSSRQDDAAEGFVHLTASMPKLEPAEAEELFQMHCPCDSPQQQSQMQELVELCDGLPFAICVVAKAVRNRQERGEGWGDLWQVFANALGLQQGDGRSSDDGRTMNAAVGLTFDQLESNHLQQALLRSEDKLQGRPLKEANACFGGDVVDQLVKRELLRAEKYKQQELLAVPEAVSVFCKAYLSGQVAASGSGRSVQSTTAARLVQSVAKEWLVQQSLDAASQMQYLLQSCPDLLLLELCYAAYATRQQQQQQMQQMQQPQRKRRRLHPQFQQPLPAVISTARWLQGAAPQLRVLKLQGFLFESLCIEGLQELRLIHLQGLLALTALTLCSLPALESLSVAACPRLASICGLASHPTLRDLSVVACHLLPSLRGLCALQHLEDLELLKMRTLAALRAAEADLPSPPGISGRQPPAEVDQRGAGSSAGADALQLGQGVAAAGQVAPLGALSCLRSLKRLRMGGLPGLKGTSLGGLRELGGLEDVEVLGVGAGAAELPRFDQVASLTRLRWSREEPVRR